MPANRRRWLLLGRPHVSHAGRFLILMMVCGVNDSDACADSWLTSHRGGVSCVEPSFHSTRCVDRSPCIRCHRCHASASRKAGELKCHCMPPFSSEIGEGAPAFAASCAGTRRMVVGA